MNATRAQDAERAARARNSLHGLTLGDAFGQTWFRLSVGEAERRLRERDVPPGPWPWTDDTVTALSLYQILSTRGTVRQGDLARALADAYAPLGAWFAADLDLVAREAALTARSHRGSGRLRTGRSGWSPRGSPGRLVAACRSRRRTSSQLQESPVGSHQ